MPITEDVFADFLNCKTKSYLKSQGFIDTKSEFTNWQNQVYENHKQKCLDKLCSFFRPNEYISGDSFSPAYPTSNYRLVIDCLLNAKEVQSRINALERLAAHNTKHSPFIPIRFIPKEKILKNDKLLLAFDALVLFNVSGKMPQFGKIVHGRDLKITRITITGLIKIVRSIVKKIALQQSINISPELILNKHCIECEFRSRCRSQAIAKDDLSLLSSMSEKERMREQSKGIFSIAQLSHTFRPRRNSKHSDSKTERYYHALKALAIREQKIHVVGKPELNITGNPIYLDIEGVPDRDFYYLIGMRFKNGDSDFQYSLWADNTSQEKHIWDEFLSIIQKVENPQLVHYGSYESVFLRRMEQRYCKDTKYNDFVNHLISEAINLLSITYAKIYFPTYSNGLKEIAQYLGFQWNDPTASGFSSLLWREQWELFNAPKIKSKLVSYNAQDCEALEIVTNTVTKICQREKNELSSENLKVVHTDTLKRKSSYHFGKNLFAIPELEKINQSAYWDYQREKIFIRTSPRLKRIAPKPSTNQIKPLPVNTIKKAPRQKSCPECHSIILYKHGLGNKIVRDLKFGKTGVKRWIVKYQYNRYICRKCKATFYSQLGPKAQNKNGLELLSYIIYHLVELRVSQSAVTNSLNQLFGFHFHRTAINIEKVRAALEYQSTYQGIVNRILQGKLVHVDETKVSIKGGSGFVWVLTNLEEVAYFYTDTREGEIVQTMLRDYNGILVSDFYAAYDSINCPQQRCLIHLMRDLNDDLMKQPFNEELKFIVRQFAELLKPIIETIDRHGLKVYFLRKHTLFVEQFYKMLSKSEFKTEITNKYKKRFLKNRDRLFTFLEYDGVPWNNNNAEHAIKSFVMLRRIIGGTSTKKGISEYLVLLSIYETCKCKGINFLNFLRSGEKDIDSFLSKKRKSQESN